MTNNDIVAAPPLQAGRQGRQAGRQGSEQVGRQTGRQAGIFANFLIFRRWLHVFSYCVLA